ncbi:MAG: ATP-grasp domain-containing protein, partial [Pseudobdellovibrionaceae bacterium]
LQEEKNELRAIEIARLVGAKLNLLGTFAVEFFVTPAGELLVNEMAPRVHNSGHFTQTAAQSSQFEMHLKSYWQKQFDSRDFESAKAFAMVNFLGPEGIQGSVARPKKPQIYWYDKEMTSPGRKLGHMIAHSEDEKALPELLEALQATERQWQESLRSL